MYNSTHTYYCICTLMYTHMLIKLHTSLITMGFYDRPAMRMGFYDRLAMSICHEISSISEISCMDQ